MTRKKIYVGLCSFTGKREIIRSEQKVTEKTHGDLYKDIIGPFKTVIAAQWCIDNPHYKYNSISEYERVALHDAWAKYLTNSSSKKNT